MTLASGKVLPIMYDRLTFILEATPKARRRKGGPGPSASSKNLSKLYLVFVFLLPANHI